MSDRGTLRHRARELVTQYDNATVASGSVVDEVMYSFDGWGYVT